ncbi:unnamed protein product [Lampetra fluviatilis]
MRSAQRLTGGVLPTPRVHDTRRCIAKAPKDQRRFQPPGHMAFSSGDNPRGSPGYIGIAATTNRLRDSLYTQAIRMLS